MVKNFIKQINIFKHWLLVNLDTVLFLLALVIADINSYHFGLVIGNYVVAATLLLIVFIMSKPKN